MGDVVRFPRDRHADLRIDACDPGPDTGLNAASAGKLPPQALAAERAVLHEIVDQARTRALMHANPGHAAGLQGDLDAIDRVFEVLRPEHFHDPSNGRVYQACQQLRQAGTPIDLVTVRHWLEERDMLARIGGEAYLTHLAQPAHATVNIETHARIVLEKWERRQFIASLQRMSAEAYDEIDDWSAYKATARVELGKLTAPRPTFAGAAIGAAADAARASIDASQRGGEPGVPWGFDTLDDFGLLAMGKQHVIAARPGMGKTALMFQVGARIARLESGGIGEAVYICSWEMSAADLLEREACSLAGVSYKALQRRRVVDHQVEKVGRQIGWLRDLPIWIDDQRCPPAELAARVATVKAAFERGAARAAPDRDGTPGPLYPRCRMRVVMIDQLSEVPAPLDVPQRWQKRDIVGATAKAIRRDVAQRLRVATVLLCQLARPQVGAKIEEPTLHELRESGQIEESADEVYAIHRRQYYEGKKCPAVDVNVAKILPLKGRFGIADEARMGFYGGQFSDELPPAALGDPHYVP